MSTTITTLAVLLGISVAALGITAASFLIIYIRRRRSHTIIAQENTDPQDVALKKALDIMQRLRSKKTEADIDYLTGLLVKSADVATTDLKSVEQELNTVDEETKAFIADNFLIPSKHTTMDTEGNSIHASSVRRASILKKAGSNDFGVYQRRASVGFPPKFTYLIEPQSSSSRDIMEESSYSIAQSEDEKTTEKAKSVGSKIGNSRSRNASINTINFLHSNPDPSGADRILTEDYIARQNNPSRTIQLLDLVSIHDYLSENYSKWGFDLYEFEKMTQGHALYFTGLYTMQKIGCLELFDMSMSTVQNWLLMIEREYFPTPYHNSTHGADVLHAICYLALENPYLRDKITNNEMFACVIAALGHDIDHPGVNNAFMVKTRNRLSLLYSDVSINENHHCSHVFLMTRDTPGADIFQNVTSEAYDDIRKLIIRLILATDMSKHFSILGQFKAKIEVNALENLNAVENRHFALEMAIKCADLSNPTKPFEISKQWVVSVMEEFYMQGDFERSLGLPVSQFMDRATTNVPKCQIGFMDILVNPLYDAWTNFNAKGITNDRYKSLQDELQRNKAIWQGLVDNPSESLATIQLRKSSTISASSIKQAISNTSSKVFTDKRTNFVPSGSIRNLIQASTDRLENRKNTDSVISTERKKAEKKKQTKIGEKGDSVDAIGGSLSNSILERVEHGESERRPSVA